MRNPMPTPINMPSPNQPTMTAPISTTNMAASVGRDVRLSSGRIVFKESASIAIPAGLTYAEVMTWLAPYIPTDGRCSGIYTFSLAK